MVALSLWPSRRGCHQLVAGKWKGSVTGAGGVYLPPGAPYAAGAARPGTTSVTTPPSGRQCTEHLHASTHGDPLRTRWPSYRCRRGDGSWRDAARATGVHEEARTSILTSAVAASRANAVAISSSRSASTAATATSRCVYSPRACTAVQLGRSSARAVRSGLAGPRRPSGRSHGEGHEACDVVEDIQWRSS